MNTDNVKERFSKFLKSQGHRITNERLLVLESLCSDESHIDAENLFIKMRGKGLKVSRATVYNTLQLLLQSNMIKRSHFGETHLHYEPALSEKQHHHILCSKCGKVEEFSSEILNKIQVDICERNKYKFVSSAFQIIGVCKKCSERK
jgi:Fur family transcriptional regulator, ferric uptake regulator